MSLEPFESVPGATYIIKSKSIDGAFVGRHLREDRSLLPKRILLLPKNFPEVPKWEIIKSHDGTYILKTRGSHASDIDKRLFGVLTSEPEATKWKIVARPHHGKNVYTISVADKNSPNGWVSPAKVYDQILVGPHIVGPSLPPHYPSTQLFEITRYH